MSDKTVHHPKVVIVMIEVGEPVSDSDVMMVDAYMRDHPRDYPASLRAHIVELGHIRVAGAAKLAELKDQKDDMMAEHKAFMAKMAKRLGK